MALQRARREQAARRADSEDGEPDDRRPPNPNSLAGDGAVFGEALPPKRRKVVGVPGADGGGKGGLGDPFGGPL